MESSQSGIPIDESDLQENLGRANHLVTAVKWTAKPGVFDRKTPGTSGWRESSYHVPQSRELSLVKIAKEIGRDPLLLPESVNHVVATVRRALCLGMHVCRQYTKFSGLEELAGLNRRGGLTGEQQTRFRDMNVTAAAIVSFVSAYYVAWELADYRSDEATDRPLDYHGLPELDLVNPVRALQCMVFYYNVALTGDATVQDELDLIKLTRLYFQAVLDEVSGKADAFNHANAFTSQTYILKNSKFSVNGFDTNLASGIAVAEFNRIEMEEIVGNREAKHRAMRMVSYLLCYDVEAQRNPMAEIGAMPSVRLNSGIPGTGKSMLISAIATELERRSRWLGLPYLFNPFPGNVIDRYQGGSADRFMAWSRPQTDPDRIFYAPIDDAEQNFEDRTRQGVSAGVKEVIGQFLIHTEGAGATIRRRGNGVIDFFTNLPEIMDKAVISRVVARARIDGARTRNDFLDQDHLWWRKLAELDPGFVKMASPDDYEYLHDQKTIGSLSQLSVDADLRPTAGRLEQIYADVSRLYSTQDHAFYAELFCRVQKVFHYFSSRDVRNIQTAINQRLYDFDFPAEWLEDPTVFFRRSYDTKLAMLKEQMIVNCKDLAFWEIRLEETTRYLNYAAALADTEREGAINRRVQDLEVESEARRRLGAGRQAG